jgi:hypothetical protein
MSSHANNLPVIFMDKITLFESVGFKAAQDDEDEEEDAETEEEEEED